MSGTTRRTTNLRNSGNVAAYLGAREVAMELGSSENVLGSKARVKASLRLGAEVFSVAAADKDVLSQQLASMKEQSMLILKDFITKHNAPIDVPDEPLDGSSEDDDETSDNPLKRSRK